MLNVSKIGALRPLEEIEINQETVQITSNGWRAGIILDNFLGGPEGRRSLVAWGLSFILTLQPKFLNRVSSYVVGGPEEFEELPRLQ